MNFKKLLIFPILALLTVFFAYISGCNNNPTNPVTTDETYLQSLFTNAYSTNQNDEDNLMSNERNDMDDGGAVSDNDGGGGPLYPIDSLLKWGRIITNVDLSFSGSKSSDDSLYTFVVTRTISGNYVIEAINQNNKDTIIYKPYTEVFKRNVIFKRVANTPYPKYNWRLYQISCLSGGTTSPQNGSSNTLITEIDFSVNSGSIVQWAPPNGDFTQISFTTLLWGGAGLPKVHVNDYVDVTVLVNTGTMNEQDNYVAWHWARNTFGFHRVPFTLDHSVSNGQGGYINYFKKRFYIYPNHVLGVFNGFISASTHESLYDDYSTLFSSTEVGIPYRVEVASHK